MHALLCRINRKTIYCVKLEMEKEIIALTKSQVNLIVARLDKKMKE